MIKRSESEHLAGGKGIALRVIALSCLKLGTIGFGGIAGMVATIENEMVIRRKWIDHQHFMDVLSASYIIPGPNAVEVVMHCGKERGGRLGLVVAGICYILPAMLICLLFGYIYQRYSHLPDVQHFIYGVRPATTALVIGTVFRLSKTTLKKDLSLIVICLLVFVGALLNVNEVILILAAGLLHCGIKISKGRLSGFATFKLFTIFLKIGAVLYGSGYVLFAYMDESLIHKNHWLTRPQLMDAIAVGQITPGPILSSATFAGYLVDGVRGGVVATVGIFLPSFVISFFLHSLLTKARQSQRLRLFLDGLSAASISIIAVVGLHLVLSSVDNWRESVILGACLALTVFLRKLSTVYIILIGSIGGFFLLMI